MPNSQYKGMVFGDVLWVILNSKFFTFLVRILIQKDNTDNKVLEINFIQRNKVEKMERIKRCKFWCNLRDLSERRCTENKVL